MSTRKKPTPPPRFKPAEEMISPPKYSHPFDWWGLAWFGAGLAMLAGSALLAYQKVLAGKEIALFRLINDLPERLRPLMIAASIAPDSLWFGAVAVIVTFILKLYRLALELAVGILAGTALAWSLKELVGRARPEGIMGELQVRAQEFGHGFPSAHTMMITVVVLVLWPYLPGGWRWAALALIPLVGLSRIYLGVHLPLDVVGGFGVGLLVVGLLRILPAKVRHITRLD